jgi:serine/threonine protein kinase
MTPRDPDPPVNEADGFKGTNPPVLRRKRGRSASSAVQEGILKSKHSTSNSSIHSDSNESNTTDNENAMSSVNQFNDTSSSNIGSSQMILSQDSQIGLPTLSQELTFIPYRNGTGDDSTADGFSTQFPEDSRSMMNTSHNLFDTHLSETVDSARLSSSGAGELISVPAPVINPFLEGGENILKNPLRKSFAPSRYMLDFEEEFLVGEGSFSKVVCARNRIDGLQYAIKKLNKKAGSDNIQRRLTKEVCALAVLQGCPQIVRYYSCWIDEDKRIFIQTELCYFGNLDMFITDTANVGNADGAPRNIASRGRSLSTASTSSNPSAGNYNPISQLPSLSLQVPNNDRMDIQPVCTPKPQSQPSSLFGVPLASISQRQNIPPPPATSSVTATQSASTQAQLLDGISESLGWLVFYEMAQAMMFMHSRNMAHMDIRPANIFITSSTGPVNLSPSHFNLGSVGVGSIAADQLAPTVREREIAALVTGQHLLKLGDFGHATSTINVSEQDIEEGNSKYLSKEVLEGRHNVDLSLGDMFALGASVYELCLGRPIQGESEEFHEIRYCIHF